MAEAEQEETLSEKERKELGKWFQKAEKLGSRIGADESTSRDATSLAYELRRRFGLNIVTLPVVVGIIWAGLNFLGVGINLTGLLTLFAIGIGLSLATTQVSAFGFGFWAFTLSLSMVAIDRFAPAAVVSLFSPVTNRLALIPGVAELFAMPPLQVLGLTVATVSVYWALDIRVFSALYQKNAKAVNPDTVMKRLAGKWEDVWEDYVGMGRALAFVAFLGVVALLAELLVLGGDVFGIVGQDPVLSASIVTNFLAWLGLGGSLGPAETWPVIGTVIDVLQGVGPTGFAMFATALLVLAVVAEEAR